MHQHPETPQRPLLAIVIGQRPVETPDGRAIPEDWHIHNISRPIYGHITWQWPNPPFRAFGWFFAAIDPEDETSHGPRGFMAENCSLDARELVFVPEEQAVQAGVQALRERYAGRLDIDLEDAQRNPRYRGHLLETGLEAIEAQLNGQDD